MRARLRAFSGWSDACILNVSSRGLMINAPSAVAAQGSTVELWHGEHVIVGTIVWRKGNRAGLQAEERVPVDEILAISHAAALQLTASEWPKIDRRRKARQDHNRSQGRAIEFAGVAVIAISLVAGTCVMFEQAFARPIHAIEAALGS